MTKEQTNKVAELLTEVGIFFANCDGDFGMDEKEFIRKCVAEIRKNNDVSDDYISVKDLSHITFDEIENEMNRVLSFTDSAEGKKKIISIVEKFIEGIIKT